MIAIVGLATLAVYLETRFAGYAAYPPQIAT
jgi:hypothetical protein